MSFGYHPLVYMWVVEFTDGSALPQFDPETGKENKANPNWLPSSPREVAIPTDLQYALTHLESSDSMVSYTQELIEISEFYKDKTVKSFGWYPFSEELKEKVYAATGFAVEATNLPVRKINIPEGKTLIAKRENSIDYGMLSGKVYRRSALYICGYDGYLLKVKEDGTITEEGVPVGE